MKCSALKQNDNVIFTHYCDILKKQDYENGSVIYVDDKRKIVSVMYLQGYKSMTEDIPFDKMNAMSDENGKNMKFGVFEGKSQLLTAD